MRLTITLLLFSSLLLAKGSEFSQVLTVAPSGQFASISHMKERHWNLFEPACLGSDKEHREKNPPCGYIMLTAKNGAVLGFLEAAEGLDSGRLVVINKTPAPNVDAEVTALKHLADFKYWRELVDFHRELF